MRIRFRVLNYGETKSMKNWKCDEEKQKKKHLGKENWVDYIPSNFQRLERGRNAFQLEMRETLEIYCWANKKICFLVNK
jgi:hypothetical protein